MKSYSSKKVYGFCIVLGKGWMFVSSQNSYVEILMPSVMIFGELLGGDWVIKMEPSGVTLVLL